MRLLGLFVVIALGAFAQEATFDIPRITGVEIDGNPSEWGSRGFRTEIMAAIDGSTMPADDFDPSFRLAWDERGLLFLATVRDNESVENDDDRTLAQADSIEILFATAVGAQPMVHAVIAPGMAANATGPKHMIADWRTTEPRTPPTMSVARTRMDGGYIVEALLPWEIHGISGKNGATCAVQIHINDMDADRKMFRTAWFPLTPPAGRTSAMYTLRLAGKPSSALQAIARGRYTEQVRTAVSVVATADWEGKAVSVRDGRKTLATTSLALNNGRPTAHMIFDLPPPGESFNALKVRGGRTVIAALSLPDATVWRAQQLITYAPRFTPPVFAGNAFPACDFENPVIAERLIGNYNIKRTFYDAQFNEVTTADSAGRYGAIIEVMPQHGAPFRRYATLYRQTKPTNVFQWWSLRPEATMTLPPDLGIDAGAIAAQSRALGTFMQWQVQDAFNEDKDAAVVLAGLTETAADSGPRGVYDDVFALDRQWWVTLKRKLNGMAASHPNPIVTPYRNDGPPATTLRVGTPEEAGFKPESIAVLDAHLKSWAADTDEAFAVCLARNGVIFFESAYGQRFGAPMTLDTKSWMASISKFLSGALMMTLVDKGLVDLDAPIDRYLPELRGIEVTTPLTIRHCFTHTNGLQLGIVPPRMFNDHYGDEMNDLEEVIAAYYPHLEVATRQGYNGVGYAVAGKVIEQISGEALPQYFRNHFWAPLGCGLTDAIDMSARTNSVPRDIATFAQVMLNKGAYGDKRFFSEETFEKMLPVKLAPYVKFDAGDLQWGIGPVWIPDAGLSAKTFGHGAASAATLRIDPENQLIIVMTRNAGGAKFGEYHPQFIKNVVDGLVR